MNENKDVKQLFYDLYNNVKNKRADDKKFEALYRQNREIAKLHYDVLTAYFEDTNNTTLTKFANSVQDFIVKEIFK